MEHLSGLIGEAKQEGGGRKGEAGSGTTCLEVQTETCLGKERSEPRGPFHFWSSGGPHPPTGSWSQKGSRSHLETHREELSSFPETGGKIFPQPYLVSCLCLCLTALRIQEGLCLCLRFSASLSIFSPLQSFSLCPPSLSHIISWGLCLGAPALQCVGNLTLIICFLYFGNVSFTSYLREVGVGAQAA